MCTVGLDNPLHFYASSPRSLLDARAWTYKKTLDLWPFGHFDSVFGSPALPPSTSLASNTTSVSRYIAELVMSCHVQPRSLWIWASLQLCARHQRGIYRMLSQTDHRQSRQQSLLWPCKISSGANESFCVFFIFEILQIQSTNPLLAVQSLELLGERFCLCIVGGFLNAFWFREVLVSTLPICLQDTTNP